jgi:hypothetical protein
MHPTGFNVQRLSVEIRSVEMGHETFGRTDRQTQCTLLEKYEL